MLTSKARFIAAATVVFLCAGIPRLQATVLYTQPPLVDGGSGLYLGGYYSQHDTNGDTFDAVSFDNFTLGSSATIESVSWLGSYVTSTGTITGFTISIWGDNTGVPDYGSAALATSFVSGTAGESFVQTDFFGNPTYSYAANFNFAATSGTQYWISIVPDLDGPARWVWETGSGGDGAGYQLFGTTDSPTSSDPIVADLTFTLYDTTVPEPVSMALVGGGLLLVGLASRRYRKNEPK